MPLSRPSARRPRSTLDTLGACTSLLCAVHCIALPALLAALPVAALSPILGDGTEWGFVALSVGLGLTSLGRGYRVAHGVPFPLLLFGGGLAALLAARTLLEHAPTAERAAVLTGAALVAGAHWWNHRLVRGCADPCCAVDDTVRAPDHA